MRFLGICLIAGALGLTSAANASAAFWFANASRNGTACVRNDPCKTIQQAVDKASDNDTVFVAAGTYNESITTAKRLTFGGAGLGTAPSHAGGTIVNGKTTGPALELTNGGTVRGMVLQGASGSLHAPYQAALEFDTSAGGVPVAYTVANVVASHGTVPNGAATWPALELKGDRPLTLNVSDTEFVGHGNFTSTVNITSQTASATFNNVTVDGGGNNIGVAMSSAGTLTVNGGDIADVHEGIAGTSGPTLLRGARIRAGIWGIVTGPGSLDIRDSLITAIGSANGSGIEMAGSNSSGQTINVTGSTLISVGSNPHGALSLRGGGNEVRVTALNSAFRAVTTGGPAAPDISAGNYIRLDARNSFYTSVATAGNGVAPPAGSGTNIAGDPGFVDPANGNYQLAAGSPLIDRGDAGVLSAGEVDLLGADRSLDGDGDCHALPDIGAYERAAIPASCPDGVTGGTGGGGGGGTGGTDTTIPRLSKVSFKPRRLRTGHKGKLRLTASEPLALTVIVVRRKGKRFKRFAKLTKQLPLGPRTLKLGPKVRGHKLTLGRYRLRLRAVDLAGNRSAERRTAFRVVPAVQR